MQLLAEINGFLGQFKYRIYILYDFDGKEKMSTEGVLNGYKGFCQQ